ncbi:hypothetical protein AHF37_02021 [Paragonimus kellicotti]|nr:hypothetical protein AHF37_02021 [Paragonimus kellicotti]
MSASFTVFHSSFPDLFHTAPAKHAQDNQSPQFGLDCDNLSRVLEIPQEISDVLIPNYCGHGTFIFILDHDANCCESTVRVILGLFIQKVDKGYLYFNVISNTNSDLRITIKPEHHSCQCQVHECQTSFLVRVHFIVPSCTPPWLLQYLNTRLIHVYLRKLDCCFEVYVRHSR